MKTSSLRGISILEARDTREGLALANLHHPEVVVVDLDEQQTEDETVTDEFQKAMVRDHSEMVVMSSRRPSEALNRENLNIDFVRKPYRYGPLVEIIDSLLEKHQSQRRAA